MTNSVRGGVASVKPEPQPSFREIHLMQRSADKVGKGLGKTTGWIHRRALELRGVKTYSGVTYRKVDDSGFHVTIKGQELILDVDNVVICAGQLSLRQEESSSAALEEKGETTESRAHAAQPNYSLFFPSAYCSFEFFCFHKTDPCLLQGAGGQAGSAESVGSCDWWCQEGCRT